MTTSPPLRIGYVPEHFSTPLHFAQKYFGLSATIVPFPSGTGHMIASLRANEIDVGIGLTEGWIAGLGNAEKGKEGYSLVGTYVDTPLCWAISTGIGREDVTVEKLKGKVCGVSRLGSGSHIMSSVLADEHNWLVPSSKPSAPSTPPFTYLPVQTFAALRTAVNDGTADFFMWEHFTSKRYYDNRSIRRIGEIYTPWPSWHIVARDGHDPRLQALFKALDKGVEYFESHAEESVAYISSALDYSEEDAKEWLGTVKFTHGTRGAVRQVVEGVVVVLQKAAVVEGWTEGVAVDVDPMLGIERI